MSPAILVVIGAYATVSYVIGWHLMNPNSPRRMLTWAVSPILVPAILIFMLLVYL